MVWMVQNIDKATEFYRRYHTLERDPSLLYELPVLLITPLEPRFHVSIIAQCVHFGHRAYEYHLDSRHRSRADSEPNGREFRARSRPRLYFQILLDNSDELGTFRFDELANCPSGSRNDLLHLFSRHE